MSSNHCSRGLSVDPNRPNYPNHPNHPPTYINERIWNIIELNRLKKVLVFIVKKQFS